MRDARWGLGLVLLGYLVAGVLYAAFTPPWQAPDEPAHYNYIRHLAEGRGFPILLPGDYPHQYLEAIKARRFPADMPITPLRYEFHQPPLYYLLAVPIYWGSSGALLPLRLFSVALGALLLLAVWGLVGAAFPGRPALRLGTVAFVAFLPMHVALAASVNNDVLAELWLALGGWGLLRALQGRPTPRHLLGTGAVLGLGLLTKTTAYILLPLAVGAVVLRQVWAVEGEDPPGPWDARVAEGVRQATALLSPAILLGAAWWGRNLWVYGGTDFLGLQRHAAIVVGQPRTGEWLASLGARELARRFLETTFHSFWGQFGWMGVLLDARLYAALGVLSLAVGLGLGAWAWRMRRTSFRRPQVRVAAWLGLWLFLTACTYLWYNAEFVQHQGRYLFPALVPLGLAFACGWQELERPPAARVTAAGLALVAAGLGVWSLAQGALDKWALALYGGGAAGMAILSWLPPWARRAALWLLFGALWVLDLGCLFSFVVPALAP
ncbi:MAG: DUF2142 domain-containing protein [Anaerolineae bacterium]